MSIEKRRIEIMVEYTCATGEFLESLFKEQLMPNEIENRMATRMQPLMDKYGLTDEEFEKEILEIQILMKDKEFYDKVSEALRKRNCLK